MKFFPKKAFAVLFTAAVLLGGCAQSSNKAEVASYNTAVINLYHEYADKVKEIDAFVSSETLDPPKVIASLQKAKQDTAMYYSNFQKITVPKGAEGVASAMKNVFAVETQGVNDMLQAIQQVEDAKESEASINNLGTVVNNYIDQHNQANQAFDAVQAVVEK